VLPYSLGGEGYWSCITSRTRDISRRGIAVWPVVVAVVVVVVKMVVVAAVVVAVAVVESKLKVVEIVVNDLSKSLALLSATVILAVDVNIM